MSQQYDDTDRGVLFKNDRKGHESQPDYTGKLNVGGVEFWLSAWIKTGQKGKFMSLSVKAKDEQAERRKPAIGGTKQGEVYRTASSRGAPDDDIPF